MAFVKLYQEFLNEPSSKSLNEWVIALLESTKNPYDVLGIPKGSDLETAKAAYRKLSMKYHPDRNQGDPRAEEMFKEISAAYEMIKSPGKNRRVVDEPTYKNTPPRSSSYSGQNSSYYSKQQASWDKTDADDRARRAARDAEYKRQADEREAGYKKAADERDILYKKQDAERAQRLKDINDKHKTNMFKMQMDNLEGNCKIVWKDLKNWKTERSEKTLYFTAPLNDYTLKIDVIQFSTLGRSKGEYKLQVVSTNKAIELTKDIDGYADLSRELSALQKMYVSKDGEPQKKSWFGNMFR